MASELTRRGFLVSSALAAGAACLPDVDGRWAERGSALCQAGTPAISPLPNAHAGEVFELHDPALLDGQRKLVPRVADEAMRRLLLAVSGQADLAAAWRALIPALAPGEIVGIKVNTLSYRVPTHPELVRPLVDSLKQGLGLPAEQIVVWDRRVDELFDAGLNAEALGGVMVEGTLDAPGTQGNSRGYELDPVCIAGRQSRLSNMITRRVDHLINFAVAKNHFASGFTGCLKNNYGLIDNPGDFHDVVKAQTVVERWFDGAIPAINALPEVAAKTRLCLLDATIGVCKGDTSDPADCYPARLLAGRDPVAIDLRARQIRDAARGELGPNPETISEGWLQNAERSGLGSRTLKLRSVS
jgi:uncharacterized protein (DUF362 family)